MADDKKLTVDQILARLAAMRSERHNFESIWQEIFDYMFVRRAPVIGEEAKGTKRGYSLYDNEAGKSIARLASTLDSMLTSGHWFDLETDNEEVNQIDSVKEWLDECTKILLKAFDNSNFSTEVYELYVDLVAICTATMFMGESKDPGRDFYFSTRHIKEVFISENDEGIVDTVYLVRSMKARHFVDRWGKEKTPEKVLKVYKKGKFEQEFDVLQAVYEREVYDLDNKTPKADKMRIASCWIFLESEQKGTKLEESGFMEFPFAVPRWSKSSGEKYGRGPGFDALASVRSANAMKKTLIRTGQRNAEPPLDVPSDRYDTVDLSPAALNWFNANAGSNERIQPIETGKYMPITRDLLNDERDNIRDIFFTNQLQLINENVMTAEEVRQRTEENMRVLGPSFGRFMVEFLDVVVYNGFQILARNGKLPEAPDSVIDKNLRVRYVSPLAKAQQLNEVKAVSYTIETAKSWAEIQPEVVDNIDFDESLKMTGDLNGAPTRMFKDEKDVKATREARQQAVEAERQAEIQAQQAQAAEKVTKGAANLKAVQGGNA